MGESTNEKLNKEIADQKKIITKLNIRLNTLSDNVVVLQGEVKKFKNHVANDMKQLVEHIKKKG